MASGAQVRTPVAAASQTGAPPRTAVRDLAVALSLANLCYLRLWSELLTYTRGDAYEMQRPPARAEYFAVMANVLLVGLLSWGAIRLVRRSRSELVHRAARWGFFLFLLLPANAIRSVLAEHFTYLKSPLFDLIGTRGVALLALGLAGAALFLIWRWPRGLAAALSGALLAVSPLVPMTFAQAAWKIARWDDSAFLDQPHAPWLAGAKTSPRVLWVIFDEWDQRLTFPERAAGLNLPEIDRFRAQSLYADNAYSPGPETPVSMPALLTGRMIRDVDRAGPSRLLLEYADGSKPEPWARQPNIFSEARAAGFNTALVGWFHPYCRVISWGLSACWAWPMSRQHNSLGSGFFEVLPNQTRSLFETELLSVFGRSLPTVAHARTYREMLDRAERVAAGGQYGLTLLHLPVPHAPHSFNRRTGRFDLGNSPVKGYLDSLVLTDRTLGELRRAMEAAGVWDNTTILLSADHSFRASTALDGKKDHRIPFLLKLAGHGEGVAIREPFNTLLTKDLILAVLRGEISTPRQAGAWLAQHRTIADSPYNYN